MDFLRWMFSDFFIFIGMLVLFGALGEFIVQVIRALREPR